ncbi:MAG: efflux transporter outer membrane subunit [Oligoflexia bacterium]|nr:efflux transporter outer membrane subunit [Oligoflexia bacterium]
MRAVLAKPLSLFLGLSISACAVGPDYTPPSLEVPSTWEAASSLTVNAEASANVAFLSALQDPTLERLLHQAASSNLNLLEADAKLQQVRALRRKAFSNLGPGVTLGAEYRRAEESSTLATFPGGFVEEKFSVGAELSWEVDLFGRLRRDLEAAEADLGGAAAARKAALLSALSEVAQEYVTLRAFQQRLEVGKRSADAARQTVDLVKKRQLAGMSSQFDVARAEALATEIEGRVPPLESATRSAMYRLAVLVGQPPAALVAELSQPSPIPTAVDAPALGVPSEILRRRPDIVVAERSLAADTARIGLAIGDLFPKFTLAGDYGYRSQNSAELLSNQNRGFSIAPNFSWPIFSWSRINANIEFNRAKTQASLVNYKRTVLNALTEVESAWIAFTQLKKRSELLNSNLQASTNAARLASQQYEAGLIDFLDKLESDKALYASQDAQLANLGDTTTQYISLCKALGGGFEMYEDNQDEAAKS